MPLTTTTKCQTYRSWVTPHFKEVFKQRQKAHKAGDVVTYNRLWNKTNHMNSSLCSAYCKSTVEDLKKSDSKVKSIAITYSLDWQTVCAMETLPS